MFRRLFEFSVCLLTTLVVGGCGGGEKTPNSPMWLNGSKIASDDLGATIRIAPNTFANDVSLKVTHTNTVPQIPGTTALLPAYQVEISGATKRSSGDGHVVAEFTIPAGADSNSVMAYGIRDGDKIPIFFQTKLNSTGKIEASVSLSWIDADDNTTRFSLINFLPSKFLIGIIVRNIVPPVIPATLDKMVYTGSSTANESGSWNPSSGNAWLPLNELKGKDIAIIVPGTWSNVDNQKPLADFLVNLSSSSSGTGTRFFQRVLGVNYQTMAPIIETGNRLALEIITLTNSGARVYLFAHSQGGLVSRWAIEKAGANNVSMLTMFGTPNEGIPFAAIATSAEGRRLIESPQITGMTDPALLDMSNYPFPFPSNISPFLHSLNDPPRTPGNTYYYTVTGDVEWFRADNDNDKIEKLTHEVLVDGPDDGVVYLSSARGQNIGLSNYCVGGFDDSHNLTLKVTHTNLTHIGDNPSIERDTLGLWILRRGAINVGVH